MPSDAFLKLLARKNVAFKNDVDEAYGSGPVNDRPLIDPVETIVEKSSRLVKEKERKRHRESRGSRHYHKKVKDVSKVVLLEDIDQAVREGDEPRGVEVSKLSDENQYGGEVLR